MTVVSKQQRRLIISLHNNGVPSSHIARRLNVDRAAVNRVIKVWCNDG